MSVNHNDNKKILNIKNLVSEEREGGETGEGGKGGSIQFHDFISHGENIRDDLLSYDDKRRLLANHKDNNELRIKKQKDKRDDYKKLKAGEILLQTFRETHGSNHSSRIHPKLAYEAQFSSSVDPQVNPSPTENRADTNEELQDELRNQLRYSPQPKFNPKPQGPY